HVTGVQTCALPIFEGITAGDKDFSSLVTKIKQADVDYVYYGGYHPELGLILRQARQSDVDAKFMGPEGVGNKDINTIAGEAAEGLLVTDRKSTRLNSSHVKISYAVFCLKKKKR